MRFEGLDSQPDPTADAAVRAEVARLRRQNNLAIFIIFIVALACIAYVQTTRFYSDRQAWRGWLVGLRLMVPLAALFLTALLTRRVIAAFIRRIGDVDLSLTDYLPAFSTGKRISTVLLAVAGVFASACLLFGHQTMDVLLALLPILLLLISRPNYFSLIAFVGTVQTMRDEAANRR